MTSPKHKMIQCAKCGTINLQEEIVCPESSHNFDLDGRPPKELWPCLKVAVRECKQCGYVNTDLSEDNGIPAAFLESDAYKNPQGPGLENDLARRFYRYHLEMMKLGNFMYAHDSMLVIVWFCDDAKDTESARHYRNKLIDIYDKLGDECHTEEFLLLHMDVMRRAGRFDELIDKYADHPFKDRLNKKIADFHILMARNKVDWRFCRGFKE